MSPGAGGQGGAAAAAAATVRSNQDTEECKLSVHQALNKY